MDISRALFDVYLPEYVKIEWSPLCVVNLIQAQSVNWSNFGTETSYWIVPSCSNAYFSSGHWSLGGCNGKISEKYIKNVEIFYFSSFMGSEGTLVNEIVLEFKNRLEILKKKKWNLMKIDEIWWNLMKFNEI